MSLVEAMLSARRNSVVNSSSEGKVDSEEADGTYIATMSRTRLAARFVAISRSSSGVGSGSTVEAVLTFEPNGAGTKVVWSGEIVTLTGLMKLAPKGLIKSTAEKVIADVWAAIRPKLNG